MFVEWRKITGRVYAYARIAEWNKDRQRSLEEKIYLGRTLEQAMQKLEEIAGQRPWTPINTVLLTQKLIKNTPAMRSRLFHCVLPAKNA